MEKATRSSKGQWAKGSSGNPNGRPTGSRNQAALAMESLLEGQAERIMQKVLERALEGDMPALRLCLERLLPPRKERFVQLALPSIQTVAQVSEAMASITAAIGEGHISPAEGEAMAGILAVQTKVVAAAELERRVEALEKSMEAEEEDK